MSDIASGSDFERLLGAARAGEPAALGQLFAQLRPYLLLIANETLDPRVVGRVGPSDVVQDTFANACKGLLGFGGATEPEFRAWLRMILERRIANVHRDHLATEKRDANRERRLESGQSGPVQPIDLAAPLDSPSGQLMAMERNEALDKALQQLRDEEKLVIDLRLEDPPWTWSAIGERIGKQEDAARKVFARALEKLRDFLQQS